MELINLYEILKHAPKGENGIKLYSKLFGESIIDEDYFDEYGFRLLSRNEAPNKMNIIQDFNNYGQFLWTGSGGTETVDCMVFPDKSSNNWDNWLWKLLRVGDYITSPSDEIFKVTHKNSPHTIQAVNIDGKEVTIDDKLHNCRFASINEIQKYTESSTLHQEVNNSVNPMEFNEDPSDWIDITFNCEGHVYGLTKHIKYRTQRYKLDEILSIQSMNNLMDISDHPLNFSLDYVIYILNKKYIDIEFDPINPKSIEISIYKNKEDINDFTKAVSWAYFERKWTGGHLIGDKKSIELSKKVYTFIPEYSCNSKYNFPNAN